MRKNKFIFLILVSNIIYAQEVQDSKLFDEGELSVNHTIFSDKGAKKNLFGFGFGVNKVFENNKSTKFCVGWHYSKMKYHEAINNATYNDYDISSLSNQLKWRTYFNNNRMYFEKGFFTDLTNYTKTEYKGQEIWVTNYSKIKVKFGLLLSVSVILGEVGNKFIALKSALNISLSNLRENPDPHYQGFNSSHFLLSVVVDL